MSCGVGHRHGSDPALLWLWHRPTATAPIRPLAWEHPNAMGVALEKTKRKKKSSSCHGPAEMNPTRSHVFAGLIPGLDQWVKDPALP